MCAERMRRTQNKKPKQVFAQSFLRKMAYVTSFGLKLPGPRHPVSESLPSHQSRKNPPPSGMFKYLAFLLRPWLRYRMRHGHGDVALLTPASILQLIYPFVLLLRLKTSLFIYFDNVFSCFLTAQF